MIEAAILQTECELLGFDVSEELAAYVIRHLVFEDNDPDSLSAIHLHPAQNRAVSRKPKNIMLRWNSLLFDSAEAGVALAAASEIKELAPLVALILWNRVTRNFDIHFDRHHALLLEVVWLATTNPNNVPDKKHIYDRFSKKVAKRGLESLSFQEFSILLRDLVSAGCVSVIQDSVYLRESVYLD